MTVLAWIIVACFGSFVVLPSIFHEKGDYWRAWSFGNGLLLILVLLFGVSATVAWAFHHLFQVYVA